MAQSFGLHEATGHSRSISLPSRPHPLAANVEEHLHRLKQLASSSSPSSISCNLCSLRDLHESFNDFLQLPQTQQVLSSEHQGEWAAQLLDGSLRLLDVSGTIRDVLTHIRESVQELQSALRRRRSGESAFQSDVGTYMTAKKKINKMVSKCILNTRTLEKICSTTLLEKDSSLVPIMGVCREVEAMTVSVLKSLLSHTFGTNNASKKSGWKLVSKLLQNKRVACNLEEKVDDNELERMEDALYALSTHKSVEDGDKALFRQNVLKQLGSVDMALNEIEEGLEPIFRCLLKTRVCLLNTLSH